MTQAAQLAQYGANNVGLSFKNRIINGDMTIDQRNNGASVTQANSTVYTLDRWAIFGTPTSKFTAQRNAGSVTPPTGFTNYLGITSSSAYSVASGDVFGVFQRIEGFNTADLMLGSANASAITLSFWVRSSLTGTFGGALQNDNQSRSYPFSYTISATNTWEQKSITILGDTTGTWATNSSTGIGLYFSMGAGSTFSGSAGSWASGNIWSATGATSVVGTNGATWQITGVQLEKGTVATSFDYLPYTTELALCQRYAIKLGGDTANIGYMAFGLGGNTTTALLFYYPQTAFRTTPSLASFTGLVIDDTNGAISISNLVLDPNGSSPNFVRLNATATGLAQFRPYFLRSTASTGNLVLSAEL